VILAEHRTDFVSAVCDRVIELKAGRVFDEASITDWSRGRTSAMIHPETSPALSAASKGITMGIISHVLELINLEAGYGDAPVFHSFSLAVPSSRVVAFWGPNGSGKSTALKAIAGLLHLRKASFG